MTRNSLLPTYVNIYIYILHAYLYTTYQYTRIYISCAVWHNIYYNIISLHNASGRYIIIYYYYYCRHTTVFFTPADGFVHNIDERERRPSTERLRVFFLLFLNERCLRDVCLKIYFALHCLHTNSHRPRPTGSCVTFTFKTYLYVVYTHIYIWRVCLPFVVL